MKIIAPAKVNLFLGIGERRADGYHDAHTVLHALALHDTLYLRQKTPLDSGYNTNEPEVQLVAGTCVEVPQLASADNLATKAIKQLEAELRAPNDTTTSSSKNYSVPPNFSDIAVRIEKNIPAQAGLGGASSDAAAALVGAAALHGIAPDHPALERTARTLGADVAFFLRGGCGYFTGTGEHFVCALEPSRRALALIKPAGGVSTPAAYQRFDESPCAIDAELLQKATCAKRGDEVPLFNNLAPAAETLMPVLAKVRTWANSQPGVTQVLLCGSGATTFALCENLAAAFTVVAKARAQGWWARATQLCAWGATVVDETVVSSKDTTISDSATANVTSTMDNVHLGEHSSLQGISSSQAVSSSRTMPPVGSDSSATIEP